MWMILSSLVILGEKHLKSLEQVLFWLKQTNFTVNLSKNDEEQRLFT